MASQKYEQWKDGLPDMKWLKEIMPDNDQWDNFSKSLVSMQKSMRDVIQIDPRLKQLGDEKMAEWQAWFNSRLDDAIKAAETNDNAEIDSM